MIQSHQIRSKDSKMKYQKFALEIFKCLLICAMIFLSFPASAQSENNKPNVDDLFQFLVDEWANKIEYSMFEGSVVTGQAMIGLKLKPNANQVLVDFANKLIESEKKWEHLPEYWQLRAHLERDNGLDWIDLTDKAYIQSPFSNRLSDLRLNQELLQKSLELEPENSEVKWFLGMLEHEKNFAERGHRTDELIDTEPEKNFYKSLIQINVDSGAINPKNAFYPFHEASFQGRMGDLESAIDSLKSSGECESFYYPRIFPSTYAISRMSEFESHRAPFNNMTTGGKYYLFLNFFNGADQLMNYIRIKNVYKDIIADSHSKDNWRETLNILNQAACVFGKGEGYETIHHLVAVVMVNLCLKEAHTRAIENSDDVLEKAVIVALGKTQIPKIVSSYRLTDDKMIFRFLYSMLIDELNKSFAGLGKTLGESGAPCITMSKFMPPVLERRHFLKVHSKFIKPIFEDLETFDYTNPDIWYQTWHKKMFPDQYKTEEE